MSRKYTTIFDLSIAASHDFSKVPELISKLKKAKIFKVSEDETIESAQYYRDAYLKDYLNKTAIEKDERFHNDLQYWSDRWGFSRAYTLNHIWILFFKDNI